MMNMIGTKPMCDRQSSFKAGVGLPPTATGVGLRPEHYRNVAEGHVVPDFLEVHSENFFAQSGGLVELLQDVAKRVPISLHGTSAGLGSAVGVPEDYLKSLKTLTDRTDPVLVSDHLCFTWGRFGAELLHGGDLLPIPYTKGSLEDSVANIDKVQGYLGRQIAVENVCAYVNFERSDFNEVEFLNQLVARTGCGLILDINNLLVNARNRGVVDSERFVDDYVRSLDRSAVREIHMAGSTQVSPSEMLIDDHAAPVSAEGWAAYRRALAVIGPTPTLIEWDNNLPSWPRLVSEATKARKIQWAALSEERLHKPATLCD